MVVNEWKLPLNLAVGFHILILVSSIYLPGFFKAKPRFADIYTVSIINVAEPDVAPPPAPQVEQPEVKQPAAEVIKTAVKPVKAKKVAPIAEAQPVISPAPAKAVSLRPLKKKVVKKGIEPQVASRPAPKPKPEPKPQNDYLAQQKRQELAKAIQEEELMVERAQLARQAVEMEKNLLRNQRPSPPVVSRPSTTSGSGSSSAKVNSSSTNQIERMYYGAITNRLLQFWALPESMQRQADLMSTAVITIDKSGQIANIYVEQRSGDRVFDQFVRKTIKAANPMPAIPPALKKHRVEIGLNFKPGGIQ